MLYCNLNEPDEAVSPLRKHTKFTKRVNVARIEGYSETCDTFKIKFFLKIVDGFHVLSIFAKISILDV